MAPPCAAAAPQRRPWPSGRATPSPQLATLDGSAWSLDAARGGPVLLNFWASWCEPCRAEMPSLERLAARHAARGLQVVAINYREGEAAIRRFVEATGLKLPVVRDDGGEAARSFDLRLFPGTVAVDRDGRARFVVLGELDWAGALAERWVAELL